MPTRRELLQQALSVPLAASLRAAQSPQIVSEPNCLSEESAAGFRQLRSLPANLIVLCGVSAINRARALALRERAASGAWIICEAAPYFSGREILRDAFQITAGAPVAVHSDCLYVSYTWPHPALTRTFSAAIPIEERPALAHYRNLPVAARRRIGRGGIVFLGSMLGPNLRAGDPQAMELAAAMLRGVRSSGTACAGTSTTASANT
jgi:hypothetical protein